MPRRTHHPEDVRTFNIGVNSTLDSELLGKDNTGEYLAARNVRPNNVSDGDFGKLKTIFGEQLLYPYADNSPLVGGQTYYARKSQSFTRPWQCMAAAYVIVNGDKKIVELWADQEGTSDPFIRLGGDIVAASPSIPINVNYPIQIDTSDSQDGCEIFFTNDHDTPVYLNLYDVIANLATTKYFEGFNIDEHGVQLKTYNHHPVFVALTSNTSYPNASIFVPPTGDPGLNVGQYLYRVRYVNTSGDRTALSIPTPMIPVLKEDGAGELSYPGIDKYGAAAGTQSNLGIVLKVRVENRAGFEYLEITRAAYANGEALGTIPSEQIIGKIAIAAGEISVKTIVDFGGYEGDVTTETSADEPRTIEAAKTLRYFQGRLHLMNVKYVESAVETDIFTEDARVFPILKSIGIYGHSDPYNHTYYKNYTGGERYGFAIVFGDSNFSKALAVPLPDAQSYQMPDRRDAIAPEDEEFFYDGFPIGTDSDNNEGANIYERFVHGTSTTNNSKQDIEYHTIDASDYRILTPKGQEDLFKDGSTQKINKSARTDVGVFEPYNPTGFQKEYYSLGLAFKGIDTSKIPSWATWFTVVRTAKAGRVKAQGLGFYYLDSVKTKSLNKLCFYSPETDSLNGLGVFENIDTNTIRAEIVAPYAFFSECYNGLSGGLSFADMAVYANIIEDTGSINIDGQIYPIKFNEWRNGASLSPITAKTSIAITSITEFSDSDLIKDRPDGTKSEFHLLELLNSVYSNDGDYVGMFTTVAYDNADAKKFHEPLYLINLVNDSAIVPDTNVTNFYDTGTFVKLKSCIGQYATSQNIYELLDERWEDCIPPESGTYSTADFFIYVGVNGEERKAWVCANNKGAPEIAVIQSAILNDGYYLSGTTKVYGIYQGSVALKSIQFGYSDGNGGYYNPVSGEEIWVYFDPRMPVSVFGGDSYVGDSVFCPIDTYDTLTPVNSFLFSYGLPYTGFEMSDDYALNINGSSMGGGGSVDINAYRQLICSFVSESQVQQNYSYEIPTSGVHGDGVYPSLNKYFPRTNYIMRPLYDINELNLFEGGFGNISNQYKIDYPNEYLIWQWGGFRYRPQNNRDYYKNSNLIVYPSKPKVGYTDRSRYRTRVVYSLERIPNVQSVPSLRTFLSGNYRDISDATGEIKYGFDALSSRGNNIFCFTDHGTCLLLIGKNILSQSDGTELATMIGTQGTYIGGEIWLSNIIGMPKEMWRSAAESDNMVMFANLDSAFTFDGDKFDDIGRKVFHNRLFGTYLKNTTGSYSDYITGGFDTLHKEYWLQIDDVVLAYDFLTEHWNDRYDYNFCKYVSFDNRMFGIGNRATKLNGRVQTYEMVKDAPTIGAEFIQNMVMSVVAPEQHYPEIPVQSIANKEFQRIKIASNVKPDEVNFYDYYGQAVQGTLKESIQGQYYLKNYVNFEQDIPRKLASADPTRKRFQGKKIVYEIKYTGTGFQVLQVGVTFKEIK